MDSKTRLLESIDLNLDKEALDRHITGNYGEDQFIDDDDQLFGYCDMCETKTEGYICEECGHDKRKPTIHGYDPELDYDG
jgi:hypothetical protein